MLRYGVASILISIQALIALCYRKCKVNQHRNYLDLTTDLAKFKFMFITQRNRLCLPHLNTRLVCGSTCSYLYLKNIISMINKAHETLSVCMYHFSIDDLHHALVNAHNRGVKVRVVSDTVMLSSTGSKLTHVSRNDIPVKIQKSRIGLMHHKFLLIDENNKKTTQVLYGSLNYTINAFINNWEFVVLTNDSDVANQFKIEFDGLWQNANFEYINY